MNKYNLFTVLGGWGNQTSAVLCNAATHDWVKFDSPNILSEDEMREFYVSFADSMLEVGRVGELPFIKHLLTCPVEVKYIGIASGFGTTATWTFCGFGENI